jgi:hypothetical protein
MAYDSRVFRILIASPSDVDEERQIVVDAIQAWNDLYSHSRKVTLLPLRWETHTAPEYGTRPQEIINRQIVDDCDLLVGLFWTRIGSPTGAADSGTLEEIERVGNAQKPIMLYFSRVKADPETIDTAQIERLRRFKAKTYPNGLVENYKSHIEFRDKFTRQLELKVRDLQLSDSSGQSSLALEFLSVDTSTPIGKYRSQNIERPKIEDAEYIQGSSPALEQVVDRYIVATTYVPAPLAILNSTASGVRNLYIELDISVDSKDCVVTDTPMTPLAAPQFGIPITRMSGGVTGLGAAFTGYSFVNTQEGLPEIQQEVESRLASFYAENLQRTETGWRLAFEWEALQSQRTRIIKPVVYLSAPRSCHFLFKARVFTDTYPEPIVLEASLGIDVTERKCKLDDMFQNWRSLLPDK